MRFLTNILAKAGLIVDGTTQLNTIANATVDTDKFLVSDAGVIKYRTAPQLVADLGPLPSSVLRHQVKLGEAINKGQAVYVSSADGTNMIVSKASNVSDLTSSKTLGLIETSGVLNDQVNVVTEGLLAGLDTSTATAGDPVWLGTNGNLIFGLVNKPSAPAHLVFIGVVTRVQSVNGEIFVKVQNGFELEELHNVAISSIANKNLLMYEAATSLWKNKTLGNVIGGTSTQYVKGDGTLGSFPDIGGGGGLVYYLNGSVSSGVAGYSQMSKTPVIGAGTDFSKTGDGLICQFLTDVNDPSLLSVPSGAWRFGLYASMGSPANASKFYVEVFKYDGTTFTLIGSSSGTPESVDHGTAVEYYTTTVAMATTALTVTDRIAVKVYATDNATRTMTIHTENSHLCDISTTFPSGIASINGLITPSQYLSTTTTGTDFTISSSSNTHYFNLPVASATVTGKLSSTDWSTFNNKQNALGYTPVNQTRSLTINGVTYDLSSDRTWSVGTVTSVGLSVPTGFSVSNTPVTGSGTIGLSFTAGYSLPTTASQSNWDTAYTNRITSLTTTGTSGAATLVSNVLNIPQYQAQGSYITSLTGEATASGPGSASVTLSTSAVTGKVLTGLNVTGGTVLATDSILTAFGKLQNQVNGLAGGVTYQGAWNASTNSPSLTSSVGTKGYYYVVSVAGSTNLNGITDWKLGDWAIFNGTAWEKVDNTDAVVSVNGFTGAVSLTTTNIAEGTNLYYTDTRARAAISLTTTGTSGAATYSAGVLNIPQYSLAGLGGVPSNRTLTINGTSYDLSADRTWTITNISGNSATTSQTNFSSLTVNSNTVLHAGNYNSYAPTLTGGGASGTWGINITGNAASASSVAWSNVSGKPSNIMYYQSFTLDANTMDSNSTGFTYSVNAPFTGPIARFSTGGGYDMWLGGNYGGSGNVFYIRTRNGDAGSMNPWRLLITDGNIGSQSVNYASSAGNADTVDGYHASTSTIGNYIVVRDGNGYIFGNYINMTDDGNPGGGTAITSFITKQGDNYYRSVSPTNAMSSIRGVASGTWGINITGNAATATQTIATVSGTNSIELVRGNMADNDQFRILVGGTGSNSGFAEIATADDGTEPIYVRQYTGVFSSLVRTATILDGSGNTSFPGTVTAPTFSGNLSGTSSNTNSISSATGGSYTWTSANYFQSNLGGYCGSLSNPPLQAYSTFNNSAFMSFHKSSQYAVNMGLDADNVLRIGGWSAAANRWELDMSGNCWVASSFRAPIFYDSNDTTYYLDPNAGSSTPSLKVAGNIDLIARSAAWSEGIRIRVPSTNTWGGIRFTRDRANNDGNWAIGFTGIDATDDLTFWGNNAGAESMKARLDKSANFTVFGSTRSPIFYDSDNTAYYLDPNGTSYLYNVGSFYLKNNYAVSTDHQYGIYFASDMDTAYAIYRESGAWTSPFPDLRISFHTGIKIGANAGYNGVRFYNDYTMATQVMSVNNGSDGLGANNVYVNNSLVAGSSLRAPIFYDSDDTGYYLDLNGTSNLNTLTTNTRARWGQSRYWMNRSSITGDQNYWTGTQGWGMDYGGWGSAWKGGFSGWDIWGTSTDHPQGSGYVHAQGIVSGQHYASSDGGSGHGWMIVGAGDATPNRYWLRGKWGGTTSSWTEMMTSNNNPYAWNMNQYVRTSDSVSFSSVAVNGGAAGYTLGVNGNIYCFNSVGGTALYASGEIYATGNIIAYSDARVKTNIREIENPLERVLKSRGVVYDRNDVDSNNNIGFIAQELEEQFPELVSTDEEGRKGVMYQNMVAVLLEAVKEQQKEIDELKAKLS